MKLKHASVAGAVLLLAACGGGGSKPSTTPTSSSTPPTSSVIGSTPSTTGSPSSTASPTGATTATTAKPSTSKSATSPAKTTEKPLPSAAPSQINSKPVGIGVVGLDAGTVTANLVDNFHVVATDASHGKAVDSKTGATLSYAWTGSNSHQLQTYTCTATLAGNQSAALQAATSYLTYCAGSPYDTSQPKAAQTFVTGALSAVTAGHPQAKAFGAAKLTVATTGSGSLSLTFSQAGS